MSGHNHSAAGTQPLHKAFSWLHTETRPRGSSFIESVADMCAGLQTCLQLVHSTDLALHARSMDDDETVPVLGTVDRERLLRLAIAVTGALADGAHQEIEWVNEQGRTKAQQEGGR
ncbi:hypothetical protein [Agrobacterium tumefaciens]|uniref:hypothetical protein n=1 Tax=Agrobacterium tumefaciens TaxID=358 RepID=UPI001573AEBD|nr:hypothetical protein [Agrobacterium tumefaciens]NTB05809.1 hypothetical protein [Agrobacterium tumefaciens]